MRCIALLCFVGDKGRGHESLGLFLRMLGKGQVLSTPARPRLFRFAPESASRPPPFESPLAVQNNSRAMRCIALLCFVGDKGFEPLAFPTSRERSSQLS